MEINVVRREGEEVQRGNRIENNTWIAVMC